MRACFRLMERWDISEGMSARERDILASRLMARMLDEADAVALHAMANAIEPLTGRVTGPQAGELAAMLVNRMTGDSDTYVL